MFCGIRSKDYERSRSLSYIYNPHPCFYCNRRCSYTCIADHAFVSYEDFRKLVKAVGSKQQVIQYSDVKVDEPGVTVGFNSLQVAGPNGIIKVIPDQNCPAGSAFLLQMDTWKLKSLGEAVRLFDGDGLSIIRDASSDSLLVRCLSYAQVSCRAPGWNCVVTLP